MTDKAKRLGNESVSYTKLENIQLSTGDFPVYNESYLTKREYFAAMAMQGFISRLSSLEFGIAYATAGHAVMFADALLEKLSENE